MSASAAQLPEIRIVLEQDESKVNVMQYLVIQSRMGCCEGIHTLQHTLQHKEALRVVN